MIKIENYEVMGLDHAIRGMRNPMNSWAKSDSEIKITSDAFCGFKHVTDIGPNDHKLMMNLRKAGIDHRKYMRMIVVYVDITGPLYWFKEFDTYKIGTVSNSCSTMHKIHTKEFELSDFSWEHLSEQMINLLENTITYLNSSRELFISTKDKQHWWDMIQMLPSSYNQKRTIMMNYEVLANIYKSRKNHKLDEWHTFCEWIESLPYSEIITL